MGKKCTRTRTLIRLRDQPHVAHLKYNKTNMALARARDLGSVPESCLPSGRILAIDYGRKRIGLALSDELGLTANPLMTLLRTNRRNDLRRLREICRKHSVARILVGHPLHLSGEAGPMADEAALFAARLQKELRIAVELVDERLTTWEAAQTMSEVKSSPRRKRTALDDVAAAVLLRDYLEHRLASRNVVPPSSAPLVERS